ncbi:toll/interleukin-1 receptor domain-containing protein [Streptomyces sp. SP17KL33]|uniref:toll/interleukin-1 receptor domain-containing protein n=1 Tax=Streptomyces sp. SP17KL33 TaxID=3002534 RepID=UPI002E78CF7C|nr:toll/interleukin-1 receptor domain-containing protein [Streptomyces sp. SP17KL33]MEE1830766.1 toll/interleukin-1 receptor domain-containing protein [Streptomyces sp. SP17KL33]
MEHDLFISHASEDKDALVRPLAEKLKSFTLDVWYDEYSLSVGDSLSASIDKGLKLSSFGVVILSPSFFAKPWPEYEFRSLVALESGRAKRIIPVWFNVERDEVLNFSPHLADKVAVIASGKKLAAIALEIMRVVHPKKFSALARALAARIQTQSNTELVDVRELQQSPLREPLSQDQLRRVRLIHESLFEVYPISWEQIAGNFQRDTQEFRERELRSWEHIAGTYSGIKRRHNLSRTEQQQLFQVLLRSSLGALKGVTEEAPAWVNEALDDFHRRLPNAKD